MTKGDSDGEGATVTCDKYAAGWLRPSVLTVRGCGECSGAVFVSEVASRTRHPCLLFQDFVPFFFNKIDLPRKPPVIIFHADVSPL